MSKLNPQIKSKSQFETDEYLAGGSGAKAAHESNLNALKRVTMANMLWEKNFYVDGNSVTDRISELIPLCNGIDVANVAISARLDHKLRHAPLFIASEMCKYENTKPYVAEVLKTIITRADMLTDFLAIYWKNGKCPLANCAKNGLREAFHNFNEYKFAKYDRNSAIKIRDVMFLVHPKARNKEEEILFKKIADRTLKVPDTWEVALSAGKDKKDTFERLIKENKLGGLAMLKNLRNMSESEVSNKYIEIGLENLNESMIMPIDYLKAYKYNPQYSRWIENSMVNSYKNLPKIPGNTLLILDVSGSMKCLISSKSDFSRLDAAIAMAILAINQCENCKIVLTAGSDARYIHSSKVLNNPSIGFNLMNQVNENYNVLGGGGIFTRQCLEWCKNEFTGKQIDRIMVFSDSQDCDHYNRIPEPFGKYNYIIDISSERYGINYKGSNWTAEISGFSDHFLQFIASYEGIENKFAEN